MNSNDQCVNSNGQCVNSNGQCVNSNGLVNSADQPVGVDRVKRSTGCEPKEW